MAQTDSPFFDLTQNFEKALHRNGDLSAAEIFDTLGTDPDWSDLVLAFVEKVEKGEGKRLIEDDLSERFLWALEKRKILEAIHHTDTHIWQLMWAYIDYPEREPKERAI